MDKVRQHLIAEGACSFHVSRNAAFDWMKSRCLLLTGDQLRIIGARTSKAQVRILADGDVRVIVWDYEHLARMEYVHFLLRIDADDEMTTLAYGALINFAALVLFSEGRVIHAGQLLRGLQRAFPNLAELEARRRKESRDNEAMGVSAYLLYFHEEAHYIWRTSSVSRDKYFKSASECIAELEKRASQQVAENDFSAILTSLPSQRAGESTAEIYPRNLIAFVTENGQLPRFIEEVACDIYAVDQITKAFLNSREPQTVAMLYSHFMMHYQIQATLEGLRRVYQNVERPEQSASVEENVENQVRNDIRGFYFVDRIRALLNPELSFWIAYRGAVERIYKRGFREKFLRLLHPVSAQVIGKAHDKVWLADCEHRDNLLSNKERRGIFEGLSRDFGLRDQKTVASPYGDGTF